MENINIIEKIKNILDTKTNLIKNSNESYVGEIYVDYNDMYVSDEKTLADLSEKGEEAIYDYIYECSCEADVYEIDYVKSVIEESLTEEELEEYEDEIDEFIEDNVYFKLPDDFVWGSKVLVDLIITAYEDWNVEFTENTLHKTLHIDEEDVENENKIKLGYGGVRWLIEQQGYSAEEFESEINIEDKPFSNKFFETVYDELINTTTSLNALVVSTKMTLKELIELKEAHKKKSLKSFKIDKTCDIGLVDFWQGAGSLLNIKLDKDLEIPLENIDDICCDSSFSYNIGNIYGHDDCSYWTEVKYEAVYND